MTDERREEIIDIIQKQLDSKREEIIPEARFIDDLGADSLDIVEMLMALEEKFEIEIPDAEAETLETVGDIFRYLDQKMA
jgi:acyl carrier protein